MACDETKVFDDVLREAFKALTEAAQERDKLQTDVALLTARRMALQSRLAQLQAIPDAPQISAWCADLTEDLTGNVGTIEIPDEGTAQVIIRPGYGGAAVHTPARDGQLFQREGMTPEQAFLAAAILPGWQKFKPRYRLGTLTAVSQAADTASVTLDAEASSAQALNINQSSTLSAVPIVYMDCNADAFEVGDRVVVEFQGQDWATPRVIGFASNPKTCRIHGLIATFDDVAYLLRWINSAWLVDALGKDFGEVGYWIEGGYQSALSWSRQRVYGKGTNWGYFLQVSDLPIRNGGGTILAAATLGSTRFILANKRRINSNDAIDLEILSAPVGNNTWTSRDTLRVSNAVSVGLLGDRGKIPWAANFSAAGVADYTAFVDSMDGWVRFAATLTDIDPPTPPSATMSSTVTPLPADYWLHGNVDISESVPVTVTCTAGGDVTAVTVTSESWTGTGSGTIAHTLYQNHVTAETIVANYAFSASFTTAITQPHTEPPSSASQSRSSPMTVSVPAFGLTDVSVRVNSVQCTAPAGDLWTGQLLDRDISIMTDLNNPSAAILRVTTEIVTREALVAAVPTGNSLTLTAPSIDLSTDSSHADGGLRRVTVVSHYLWTAAGLVNVGPSSSTVASVGVVAPVEFARLSACAGDPWPPTDLCPVGGGEASGNKTLCYTFEVRAEQAVSIAHMPIPHDVDGQFLLSILTPRESAGMAFDPDFLATGTPQEITHISDGDLGVLLGAATNYRLTGVY